MRKIKGMLLTQPNDQGTNVKRIDTVIVKWDKTNLLLLVLLLLVGNAWVKHHIKHQVSKCTSILNLMQLSVGFTFLAKLCIIKRFSFRFESYIP